MVCSETHMFLQRFPNASVGSRPWSPVPPTIFPLVTVRWCETQLINVMGKMKAQSRSRNGQFKQTNRRPLKPAQPAMMPPNFIVKTAGNRYLLDLVAGVRGYKVSPVTVTVCSPRERGKSCFVNTRIMTAVMSSVWWQPAW